jgi:hypothetical protein
MVSLTTAGTDETGQSSLPCFERVLPALVHFVCKHISTTSSTSSTKDGNSGTNGSNLDKDNILKPTFNTLKEVGHLRLSHLTAMKQKHNEPAANYIRRFRDTKNQCFNLNISNKDLADLAYSGLSPHLKEKLESDVFFDVSQVLQRALNCKS